MKTKVFSLIIGLLLIGISSVFGQETKSEEFKVYGNCGMCENRIEKAVKALEGISKADWDKETKIIKVSFNPGKIKLDDIHKAIVEVGQDTDRMKADDKVYNELPGCCKYERSAEENLEGHTDHSHQ